MKKGKGNYKEQVRRKKVRNRAHVTETKSRPCADCNVSYPPVVMDFHHVRGVKKYNISKFGSRSTSSLLREMAKCDILCANCHRIRHALARELDRDDT